MFYVEVLVSSNKFHGAGPLTYSAAEDVPVGTLVNVPLRANKTLGIVSGRVNKPSYPVKPVVEIFDGLLITVKQIEFIKWLSAFYPSNISSIVSLFLPNQLSLKTAQTKIPSAAEIKDSIKTSTPKPDKLTEEQSDVIKAVQTDQSHSSFLIHGETGTGKTRVYIELVNEQLRAGKSAIVLTPEISLTPQLLAAFKVQIKAPIFVIHSNLTEATKRNIWLAVNNNNGPVVVIGPRSALFAPIKQLGIIVIDECHDSSYKQDQFPKYNALFVAGKLAQLYSAKLIIGSATPNITDYYMFKSKGLPILRMRENATGLQHKPKVTIVDLKDKSGFSQNPHLSNPLIQAIKESISDQKQALIFLNKRGSARLVSCESCDWVGLCPNCQLPLTFHGDNHSLRCHTCGYKSEAIIICPSCGSSDISYRLLGTKSLFDQLVKLFPEANIKRFDTDSTKSEKLENNYQDVKSGKVDIIVGTQILAKGLDLPKLNLVGVVSADSNLSFPDYRSEENNYQLIKQIMGRVSRGHTEGQVIIQSLNPNSVSLLAAIGDYWSSFYESQLIQRKDFYLPPYCYVLKVLIQMKSVQAAISSGNKIIKQIEKLNLDVDISGPAPRFVENAMGKINWQIIIKSANRSQLIAIIKALPSGTNYDLDPTNLL